MSELKSIILSSRCILFSLLFLITKMTTVVALNDQSFRKQIFNELPTKTDFYYYLEGLEKAVDFCLKHKVYVDASMGFGLFMVDVTLKDLVQEKHMLFSKNKRFHLGKLLIKINVLTKFFHKMIDAYKADKDTQTEIKLTQLFYNRTTWSIPADKFNLDLLKQTKVYSPEMLEKMYGKWEDYLIFAVDVTKYIPTPANLDVCTADLASNPVHSRENRGMCQIPYECHEALDKGSDYGYGLSHRTLLMVIARFSRDCVMNSRGGDKFKTDTFCMMAFNEAEYIALNNFEMPDLMFEQISLCSLLGHAQFLRNSWLKSLLQFQTQEGCFTHKLSTGEFNENLLRQGENDSWGLTHPTIMNGQCDGQFTAGAAAALANALRYIIEKYY